MRFPKRKPMKQWIKEKLDSKSYPGLRWLDKRKGKFEISWKHGSLQDWRWDEDVKVFREWAIYTGKYQQHNGDATEEDLELAKKWKTNFRCALNALPGLEMVREESLARGADARKVFIMKVSTKRKQKSQKKRDPEEDDKTTLQSTDIGQETNGELSSISVEELQQFGRKFKRDDNMAMIQDLIENGNIFSTCTIEELVCTTSTSDC